MNTNSSNSSNSFIKSLKLPGFIFGGIVTLLTVTGVLPKVIEKAKNTVFPASIAQIPGIGDSWRDIIDANGYVLFVNTARVWQEDGRTIAQVRYVKKDPSGHADYNRAPDQYAATDCVNRLHIFSANDDYKSGPLEVTGGLGGAVIGFLCGRRR